MTQKSEHGKHHALEAAKLNLTKEMLADCDETFKMVCDMNGLIPSVPKLNLALKSLGMSIEEVSRDEVNYQDDPIDFEKFILCVGQCVKKNHRWATQEMQEVYHLFDKDGNGYVDPMEVRRVFYRLGEQITESEIEDQLREIDIDGDTQMAVVEFYKMVCNTKGSDFIFDDAT
eukprot:gene4768-6689_t